MARNRDRTDVALSLITGLLREGGATTSTRVDDAVPATGFMVGGVVTPLVLKREEIRPSDVVGWLERTAVPAGAYVGAWEADGLIYLDVSENVTDRAAAEELAHARGELAIWDLEGVTEVPTA